MVKWGGRGLVSALHSNRLDILQFLYENTPHGVTSDRKEALMGIDVQKIVDLLKPRDGSNCNEWPHTAEPIGFELLLDNGRLDDKSQAAFALGKLVQHGHLDLMKKIWEKHAQLTSMGDWMNEWMEAMATTCQMGNLAILQWMMEHTSGRAVIAHYKKYDGRVSSLLFFATDAGHLDAMEYLYQQGAAVELEMLYCVRFAETTWTRSSGYSPVSLRRRNSRNIAFSWKLQDMDEWKCCSISRVPCHWRCRVSLAPSHPRSRRRELNIPSAYWWLQPTDIQRGRLRMMIHSGDRLKLWTMPPPMVNWKL